MAGDNILLPSAAALRRPAIRPQSAWARLLALLRCWRARARGRHELAQMGPLAWRDLGLSDLDQRREVNKPFWRP
jgi:uncharacterized protein YjiS (DUF1127 family)